MELIRAALLACLLGISADVSAATNDPLAKLNDAAVLFGRQDRPLPAEKLIFDALTIYLNNGDSHGVASAYREYADFLRSSAVAKFEIYYRKRGFIDTSITFDNRFEKAREFLGKALENYERAAPELQKAERYDALTNVYVNMAWVHVDLGQKNQACLDFALALEAYHLNIQQTPSAQPSYPRQFSSMPEAIAHERQRAGCIE
jgi:tetratricopeptide (TPR) repeat protein